MRYEIRNKYLLDLTSHEHRKIYVRGHFSRGIKMHE